MHDTVFEWGRMPIGEGSYSRAQADALFAAAKAHPQGGSDGTDIIVDHHRHLRARQSVGVLASQNCSLEILPKVDPDGPSENPVKLRERLVHMLDVALGLGLTGGQSATMARQNETLLDIFIRLFADRLIAEARRGLPRRYQNHDEDLATLRGRLDVTRQFTAHAVRPDRIACSFDALSADTPLLQIMKACAYYLSQHARALETKRKLHELRLLLSDVKEIPASALPWQQVRIDRTNRRWQTLFDLACMFMKREWQATHFDNVRTDGISLLFPMNDLFESYVATQLRRVLMPYDIEVVAQGGLKYCLGDWSQDSLCRATLFQTKPDIIIRRGGKVLGIIDTKWKQLSKNPLTKKHGVGQTDVYQLMAYARLYDCKRLMLLYPSSPGKFDGIRKGFGIANGTERLDIASLDISQNNTDVKGSLHSLAMNLLGATDQQQN